MSTQNSESYRQQTPGNQQSPFEHIVIVENNEADLFIHQTLIKTMGLGNFVEKRHDYNDLLNELSNATRLDDVPDLILLSLQADSQAGYNFLDQFALLPDFIRNKCKLIIVSSANSKEEKLRAIMNPSVIRYLEKPIDVCHFRDFMYM